MQRLFKPLAYVAVPVAAFLTFLIQPIVGKLLMPLHGGSAGTWMTISLFFQAALLAGYALAFWLLRQPSRLAGRTWFILALLAPLTAKLPPWAFSTWPEWPAIVTGLSLSLLPALLLTTSTGIVLQGWIREREGRVPYYLYGISNLGSLLALLCYPFVVEPRLGLTVQIQIVRALLILLSLLVLGLLALNRQRERERPAQVQAPEEEHETIPISTWAIWLGVAFGTCTLMLGSIRILSAELGSNPLSWLVPLGIYLLSFSITFSGWWRPAVNQLTLVVLGAALFAYMMTKGVGDTALLLWPRTWLILLVASGSLAGHGLIYQWRPRHRFSLFYLVVAIGGALGGLFASVGAPNFFDRNIEFAGAGFFLFVTVALCQIAREGLTTKLALTLILATPPVWLAYAQLTPDTQEITKVTHLRNYYGTLVVRESEVYVSASNETTLHGMQLLDEKRKTLPTTYYTHGSAVGIVLDALEQAHPVIRVGVVGLGTGTLAAYARSSDIFVFWDINPLALTVANKYFSFVKDSPGHLEIRLKDGRLGMRATNEKFDALVIDAFSGDSIPMHLLTREAIGDYMARLDNGILLVHVSNRYVDLAPVLATHAKTLGLGCLYLDSTPNASARSKELASSAKYVVLYPLTRQNEVSDWITNATKRADYDYQQTYPIAVKRVDWTDDRHAITDVFK